MKKIKIFFLLMIVILLMYPQDINAEDLSGKTWWIYDHTDNDTLVKTDNQNRKYIEKNIGAQHFVQDRHIEILDSGNTLRFTGYPELPYSDMLFYPSTDKETKTFEFSIKKQDQTDMHTFVAFGLWINSKITGEYPNQLISGYLLWISLQKTYVYEINSLNISQIYINSFKLFDVSREGLTNYELKPLYLRNLPIHGQINESAIGSASIDNDVYYKLEVKESSLRLWRSNSPIVDDSSVVNWELDSSKPWMSDLYIENKNNAYGFGPMMQYAPHNCSRKTVLTITDLIFPVTLSEGVVEEPIDEPKKEEPKEKVLTCADSEYEKEHHCECKKVVCDETFPKDCLGKIVYDAYQIIKIVSTILLVVFSIMDFVKAMSANDDEKMKKSINNTIKRVIVVVILLFGPTIINFLLGLFSNGAWSTCGIK